MDNPQQHSAAETERMMKLQDVLLEGDGEKDQLVGSGRDHRSDASYDGGAAVRSFRNLINRPRLARLIKTALFFKSPARS